MANNINYVNVSGNITRDSELRHENVLAFSIACSESRKQGDEWVDYPNYFDCVLFGKRAAALQKYLVKGAHVVVSGSMHQSRYEVDGSKRSRIEIHVNDIEFTAPRNNN